MNNTRYVKVDIDYTKPPTSAGFGYPLIFEGKATTAIPYTECASIDEVIKAVGGITAEDNEEAIATKTATAKETAIYKAAVLMLMQDDAPSKIAVCASTDVATTGLASILHYGWRQLVVTSVDVEGEDTIKIISDFIETTNKMYFASVATVAEATIEGNDRTIMLVHDEEVVCPEAALVGATAGNVAGSITYAFRNLKGLTAKVLTDAEIDAIHNANAMCYIAVHGMEMTSEGKTTGDTYVDIIDAEDFIIQEITYRTLQLFVNNKKVPYDNTGISMLESACINVLNEAANNGIVAMTDAGTPDYDVNYKPRSQTSPSDRAARRYVEGEARFGLAGAIHGADVNVTIDI